MKKLFKGKRVTVMGLGLNGGGVGVARFFAKQGASVLVTDLKTEEQLKESLLRLRGLNIEYVLGSHRQENFINTDLVIKNPAVPFSSPYLKIAEKNNVDIKTDISVFFDLCKAPIIGVTGTKGKSTTATLIFKLLKRKYNAVLAGNIGVSVLEVLPDLKKDSIVVLELSSFELEGLKKSPKIAVFTTLLPDHLDRYKSFEEYIRSKNPIFENQKKEDILVLNYDNPYTRKLFSLAKSNISFFSLKEKKDVFIEKEIIFFRKESVVKLQDIALRGSHNLLNILASVLVAKILKVDNKEIKDVLKTFQGVPFRQEFIAEISGVKYFNDTAATMPEAVIEAIKTFNSIVLIAGGQNKNLDYKALAKMIDKKVDILILLPGTASDLLLSYLKKKEIFRVSSMKQAVQKAFESAKSGNNVLLSPGAASFNLFKNEFDRGRQFNEQVNLLIKNEKN